MKLTRAWIHRHTLMQMACVVLGLHSMGGFALAETKENPPIFVERFDNGMDRWWVEGGQRVWVEDGRLHVKANPEKARGKGNAATVWCRQRFEGDVRVELDAHVVDSNIGANNINLFLHYSDPSGQPLFETRDERTDGAYSHYFDLNGYIFTFLRDRNFETGKTEDGQAFARFRMRRCPGFNLIDEAYDPMGVHVGQTYHIVVEKRGRKLSYSVDGKQFLEITEDKDPHEGGLLGLRTFATYLWWDNIKVYSLNGEEDSTRP